MYTTYRYLFFFFKQNTAYEMRISDWSSDVCSSDLLLLPSLLSCLVRPALVQRRDLAERRLGPGGHRRVRPHVRTPMRRVAERALYHEHVLARLDFPAANAQQHVVHPVESVADGQLGQAGLHAGAAFVRDRKSTV